MSNVSNEIDIINLCADNGDGVNRRVCSGVLQISRRVRGPTKDMGTGFFVSDIDLWIRLSSSKAQFSCNNNIRTVRCCSACTRNTRTNKTEGVGRNHYSSENDEMAGRQKFDRLSSSSSRLRRHRLPADLVRPSGRQTAGRRSRVFHSFISDVPLYYIVLLIIYTRA